MQRAARQSVGLIAAVATAGSWSLQPLVATEWKATPSVALGAGNDTNLRLLPEEQEPVASAQLIAGVDVVGRDTGFDFRFRPEVRSLRYDDPGELDRDDAFSTLDLALTGERQRWSLDADYARESTLTSEFESTGFVVVDVEREQSEIDTAWIKQAGSRGRVSLTAFATDIDYEERFLSPLVDYRYKGVQAGYGHAASERATWQFGLIGSRVETPALRLITDSATFDVTWTRKFDAGLSVSFGAGAFEVEAASGPFVSRTSGETATFTFDKRWSRWTFSVAGARELRPDGRGTLSREDGVDIRAARRITERITVTTTARAARVGAVGDRDVPYARDYALASVTVDWRMAEHWDLTAVLLARAQELPDAWRARGRQGWLSVGYRGG